MRKTMILAGVLALIVMSVAIGDSAVSAATDNSRNEVVHMRSVGSGFGGAYESAAGTVKLVAYYDDHENPHFGGGSYQLWFNLRGLTCTNFVFGPATGEVMYTAWVETPTNGRHRLFNFNSECFTSVANPDYVDVVGALPTMLEEDVTIEITVEGDGEGWPDGTVLMRGSVDRPIGESTVPVSLVGSCGDVRQERCESLLGDVVTDSWRATYGTDFALSNSGGLTGDLTCPVADDPDDSCPAHKPPNFDITIGTIGEALRFNNDVYIVDDVSGTELKTMLERGVWASPDPWWPFAQVSGLCFTYDITAAPGSRVLDAVWQAEDGTCTSDPIDLTAGSTYSLAQSAFTAAGGDGYPDFVGQGRGQAHDSSRTVLADWIAANTPISPTIDGRITCVGAGCPVTLP